ncbi:MAG: phosphoribosyltransferase family protein [Thaumarchaeota archaeon]|nr:phosphoribosyltransferase family protein [Nitrososphaerota archaeon]
MVFKLERPSDSVAWKKRRAALRELAEGLMKAGALQFGTFTLADGTDSPYYINLRGLPSYPGVYGLVVEVMTDLVVKKAPKADALCGVPMTGLAIASPIAISLKKPLIYVRRTREPDNRVVEGEVRPDWKVVLVDDLSTSGKTLLTAAKLVGQEGGDPTDAVVLIDRLEGARERLSKEGVALHATTDVIELADTLFSMELITEANLKAITKSVGGR